MKIQDYSGAAGPASIGGSQEAQKTERSGAARTGEARSAQGDRVEFSAGLDQLSRAISSYGADRAKQVEALGALYRSGDYRPDSAATSRAMVAEGLASV